MNEKFNVSDDEKSKMIQIYRFANGFHDIKHSLAKYGTHLFSLNVSNELPV
jgi:hypothetical protein